MAAIREPLPAPRGIPKGFCKSNKKSNAMQCLGLLDLGEEDFRKVHDAIWADVSEVQRELVAPGNLERNLKPNPKNAEKPGYSDMHKEVHDEAVQKLYERARPDLKAWYDHWNSSTDTKHSPNWFLYWFLYASFRYRDYRNGGRRKTGSGGKTSGVPNSTPRSLPVATMRSSARSSTLVGSSRTPASFPALSAYSSPATSARGVASSTPSMSSSYGPSVPSMDWLTENSLTEQEMYQVLGLKHNPVRDRNDFFDPVRDAVRKAS